MTDHEFFAAMRIVPFSADQPVDPLMEALRIDDLRSEYCQRLELRIMQQQAEIESLRGLAERRLRRSERQRD